MEMFAGKWKQAGRFLLAGMLVLVCAHRAGPAQLEPISVPAAGGYYVDSVTGNKVWRVTDRRKCPRGGTHYYSYWPVWNASGTHLLAGCKGYGGDASVDVVLVRDSYMAILGDALRGRPPGVDPTRLFWSWKREDVFYLIRGNDLWEWNPLKQKGTRVKAFGRGAIPDWNFAHLQLAYVSFDDRYFLLQMQGDVPGTPQLEEWNVIGLLVYDRAEDKILPVLDTGQFKLFDEAVFTRANKVYVMTGDTSYAYELDFSSRVRVSNHGHHAHGLLPDGTAVAAKPGPDCEKTEYWKPAAALFNEATGALAAQIGCERSETVEWDHYSWNNMQRDQFFASTWQCCGPHRGPLQNGIVRVRLEFDAAGKINGQQYDVLAYHRSEKRGGYAATPRVTCNQQGTRCLFASSMTVETDKSDRVPDLFVVEAPPSSTSAPTPRP